MKWDEPMHMLCCIYKLNKQIHLQLHPQATTPASQHEKGSRGTHFPYLKFYREGGVALFFHLQNRTNPSSTFQIGALNLFFFEEIGALIRGLQGVPNT